MKPILDFKKLGLFVLAFILFTVIGTLSHEMGHIAIARILGNETTQHYNSMNYHHPELQERYRELHYEKQMAENQNSPFQEEDALKSVTRQLEQNSLWVCLGGPIQTMLTGIIGLILLYSRREKRKVNGFRLSDWIGVFLALFWLREIFNLLSRLSLGLISGNGHYFGGDEERISNLLRLGSGTIPILFGLIGLLVSIYTVMKVIEDQERLNFLLGGLLGGFAGWMLWMEWFGPWLLP